jgi:hypothetical protein
MRIGLQNIHPRLVLTIKQTFKQIGEGNFTSDFSQGDEVYGQAGVVNGGVRRICRNGFGKDGKYCS